MKRSAKLAVLIVSAGYSSRMNAFKPLLNFQANNALLTLIHTYQAFGIDDIYVVTGHRHEEIEALLKPYPVYTVYNQTFDEGMFNFIQAGLRAMHDVDAFFMQPVDIPLIKKVTLERLSEAYEMHEKGVIYPTFFGKKGHPPLISFAYKEAILASKGDGGLKKVLEAFEKNALCVSVCDQAILMDMDTKEDYQALVAYDALQTPSREECLALMAQNNVPEHIIKHCEAVEAMAQTLCKELASYQVDMDEQTLYAAALLHDIARLEKDHAHVGAEYMRGIGYERIGNLIETHMDIEVDEKSPLSANEVLFLADKMTGEDIACGLEKRFEKALKKCEGNEVALQNIQKRFDSACAIIRKIEKITQKKFNLHYQ